MKNIARAHGNRVQTLTNHGLGPRLLRTDPARVLLIEEPGSVCDVRAAVAHSGAVRFTVVSAEGVQDALLQLSEPFDFAVLESEYSAAHLVKTLAPIRAAAPDLPILLLPSRGSCPGPLSEPASRVQKRELAPLAKAVGSVLDRRGGNRLAEWAFLDDLSGVYNRRGFFLLAEQYRRIAQRSGNRVLVFLADVDGLKHINDTFGHAEGDRAIVQAGEVLCKTFRDSDVIGRLGGDEFAVVASEELYDTEEAIRARLLGHLAKAAEKINKYRLGLSFGVARSRAGRAVKIEELLAEADRDLYQQKRNKTGPSPTGFLQREASETVPELVE